MRYSNVAAPFALVAGANAWNTSYTTEVVTSFTTYCPEATTLTQNSKAYTVTKDQTLTITDCPCTLTHPIVESSATPAPISTSSVAQVISIIASPSSFSTETASQTVASSATVVSVPSVSAAPVASGISPAVSSAAAFSAPYPTTVVSASVALGTAAPIGSASSVPSSPVSPVSPSTSPFTGAGKRLVASGTSIAAVFALAAFFL